MLVLKLGVRLLAAIRESTRNHLNHLFLFWTVAHFFFSSKINHFFTTSFNIWLEQNVHNFQPRWLEIPVPSGGQVWPRTAGEGLEILKTSKNYFCSADFFFWKAVEQTFILHSFLFPSFFKTFFWHFLILFFSVCLCHRELRHWNRSMHPGATN